MAGTPNPHGRLGALGVTTLSLFGGLACAGNIDPTFLNSPTGAAGSGGGPEIPHCDEAVTLLKTKCAAIGGCHVPGNTNAGGLDLSTDNPALQLLAAGSPGDVYEGKCGTGTLYLVPHTNPAQGLFVDKLTDATCGERMPEVVTWTDAANQCLLDWATSMTAP